MATTGIWKVEKRLDHVIDYVINPEKTMKDGDYQELHKLDGYEKLNYETEEELNGLSEIITNNGFLQIGSIERRNKFDYLTGIKM
jgi:hypothetical protein